MAMGHPPCNNHGYVDDMAPWNTKRGVVHFHVCCGVGQTREARDPLDSPIMMTTVDL